MYNSIRCTSTHVAYQHCFCICLSFQAVIDPAKFRVLKSKDEGENLVEIARRYPSLHLFLFYFSLYTFLAVAIVTTPLLDAFP